MSYHVILKATIYAYEMQVKSEKSSEEFLIWPQYWSGQMRKKTCILVVLVSTFMTSQGEAQNIEPSSLFVNPFELVQAERVLAKVREESGREKVGRLQKGDMTLVERENRGL